MIWGRIILLLVGLVLAIIVAFFSTPELNNVENKTIYRLYFMLGLLRGWTYMWFVMFGVFPLE